MSTQQRVKTMDLKGNEYAKVADRLLKFREENIRASIKTEAKFLGEGRVQFIANILKDKADPTSADSMGNAFGKEGAQKEFEKLETIAIGRALAILGYAASGEIASSEEMEEFLQGKEEKMLSDQDGWAAMLTDCPDMESLQTCWNKVPPALKVTLKAVKEDMKAILATEAKNHEQGG